MEGLIPFICKAIKERRTRSYSRCSSSYNGGSSPPRGFGGAAVEDDNGVWEEEERKQQPADGAKAGGGAHRRHRSLEELAGEVGAGAGAPEYWRRPAAGAMRRGRSVRIFSCIGGM